MKPTKSTSSRPAGPLERAGERPPSPAIRKACEPGGAPRRDACFTPAERTLVEFVVWELRVSDLPAHVREAALQVMDAYPRPERLQRGHHKTAGRLIVTGFPRNDEEACISHRAVWPHQVGDLVGELLDRDCGYVLVQDPSG